MSERLAKPADSTWTDEQWEAIRSRGSDLLVAAAAGSGKTAVLVERIIRRITDESDPVDIDRLLVATFTNAAAAEMRQRIREALEAKLAADPASPHIRRQLVLIGRAQITTLHSFCLEVVRRHFQRIPIDPNFRIANETESELLRQDVLEELFESHYADSGEADPFWRLIDWFAGDRGDEALFALVLRLHDFSRSHPFPDRWLARMAEAFRGDGAMLERWTEAVLADVRIELAGAAGLLREADRLCGEPGGPGPYADNLREDAAVVAAIEAAVGTGDWNAIAEALRSADFGRLKPVKKEETDPALQERVKELRDRAKKRITALKIGLFARPLEDYVRDLREAAPIMGKLVELVVAFGERFRAAKHEKGIVDFSDLEHDCLAVLTDPGSTEDDLRPSPAAGEYRERFEEVLVDEYQDTNRVQEAMLALISRTGGNRFMVGDVKQSIYRFRLAEPGLFLDKYRAFRPHRAGSDAEAGGIEASGLSGRRIDLARNFRSRREVVDGVNGLFAQIMHRAAAEIDYDDDAKLIFGAGYYPDVPMIGERTPYGNEAAPAAEPSADSAGNGRAIELALIDLAAEADAVPAGDDASAGDESDGEEREEVGAAQLEARLAAMKIREWTGMGGVAPALVYDKATKTMRPATFRDVVVLLRSTKTWAPIFVEELRKAGIPAYAELSTGYFDATEVEVLLSLLQVIDNPYQDIPLAGVLRSPIGGLTAEELACIRLAGPSLPYFEAAQAYAGAADVPDRELSGRRKLGAFLTRLDAWREEARRGALADLIWRIYRETGYYDLVGGLPGGQQRQANLRALYDRARTYEATSFRGLFRFLRFIERLREAGGDLGAAGAIGEQEDVVRVMSIHKSKGLEFPIVLVAGAAKRFNMLDLNGAFLLHKELGFGPQIVDTELRVRYPSLPFLAIRGMLKRETLAEEMRVLYVALTRAKEKLMLVGTVNGLEQKARSWAAGAELPDRCLPAHTLLSASCYLDWIGAALMRHPQAAALREAAGLAGRSAWLDGDHAPWKIERVPASLLNGGQSAVADTARDEKLWQALRDLRPVEFEGSGQARRETERRLGWTPAYALSAQHYAKTSATEMKRLREWQGAGEDGEEPAFAGAVPTQAANLRLQRPRFMQRKELTPVEKGTVYHAVMQQIPLHEPVTTEIVERTIAGMIARRIISEEQAKAVDPHTIRAFFDCDAGQRMQASPRVMREVPFSFGLPARDVYPGVEGAAGDESVGAAGDESVLVQGVIDCLYEIPGGEGFAIVDYKTDALRGGDPAEASERYRLQLDLYGLAVERITGRPVQEKVLYFFDGARAVRM